MHSAVVQIHAQYSGSIEKHNCNYAFQFICDSAYERGVCKSANAIPESQKLQQSCVWFLGFYCRDRQNCRTAVFVHSSTDIDDVVTIAHHTNVNIVKTCRLRSYVRLYYALVCCNFFFR